MRRDSRARLRSGIRLLALCVLSSAVSALPARAASIKVVADRPAILDGRSDRFAADYVLVTTPVGISVFNRSAATWSRVSTANGLPDNRVLALGLDEGILWVATGQGLASADIRVNDWRRFETPGRVLGLTFDPDYLWTAGDSGLLRFDKFSETWTRVAACPVNDVLSDKGSIWLATDSGVRRYRPQFESFEAIAAPVGRYHTIVGTPRRIWFLGETHAAAFDRATEAWSACPGFPYRAWSGLGDSLLLVTDSIMVYEPNSDAWLRFPDLADRRANGLYARPDSLLLATDQGLTVYSWQARTSRSLDRRQGLTTDSLLAVYDDGAWVFLVSARDIQYRSRAADLWQTEPLAAARTRRAHIAFLDDAGAHLQVIRGLDLRLAGRAYYSLGRTWPSGIGPPTDYENIALTATGAHRSGRSLALYYDDTDRKRIGYGLEYRGAARDLLYRVGAGDIRSEFFQFDLVPGFSLLGAGVRLRRDEQSLHLQAGELRSQLRTEFFAGRARSVLDTVTDIAWERGWYDIDDLAGLDRRRSDTVFVDDLNPGNNTPGTRPGFSVGGISGDFDVLLPGSGYDIDARRGVIRLARAPAAQARVVLLVDGAATELTAERRLVNNYRLGAGITPGTLRLEIRDTLDARHPLSEFGLDQDLDEQPDPSRIDFNLGVLTFPDPRPFPPQVYDSSWSVFRLVASFEQQAGYYTLTHCPVERNSEQVTVDGELLTRGSDYVIDYTSGSLVFLREDIVGDLSEVAVRYSSVEPGAGRVLVSAQPLLRFGPDLALAPGFALIDTTHSGILSGEAALRLGRDDRIKLVPQLAWSGGARLAQSYVLAGSYRILNARAEFRDYAPGFAGLGAEQGRYGQLRWRASGSAGIEPWRGLRLDAALLRERQADTLGLGQDLRYLSAKLGFRRTRLPYGYLLAGRDSLPDASKLRIRANAGYDIPFRKTRLKLDILFRQEWARLGSAGTAAITGTRSCKEDTASPAGSEATALALRRPVDESPVSGSEYIGTVSFSLPKPVSGNLRLRRNRQSAAARPGRADDEARARLNFDLVPGLYLSGHADLKRTRYPLDARAPDCAFDNALYSDLKIAPGRWWPGLSIVNLGIGASGSFSEYLRPDSTNPSPGLLRLRPLGSGTVSSIRTADAVYGTIELTPWAVLCLRLRRTVTRAGSGRYGSYSKLPAVDDEARVEYSPPGLGAFILLMTRKDAAGYPQDLTQSLYLEWNRPWSMLLRTRMYGSARFTDQRYASSGRVAGDEYKASAAFEFRFDARSYGTINIGAARRTQGRCTPYTLTRYALQSGLGANVNLLRFLYLQADFRPEVTIGSKPTLNLTVRLTGRL
jgi:hypothetical protein